MTDGFATALFFSVVAVCITILIWDDRRTLKAAKSDERMDRVVASLQREASERGKLSKRLAQAETKVARLQKRARDVASGAGERNDD